MRDHMRSCGRTRARLHFGFIFGDNSCDGHKIYYFSNSSSLFTVYCSIFRGVDFHFSLIIFISLSLSVRIFSHHFLYQRKICVYSLILRCSCSLVFLLEFQLWFTTATPFHRYLSNLFSSFNSKRNHHIDLIWTEYILHFDW